MDKSERARLKQLAIDMIVANPVYSTEAKLAEALEKCVDELDDANAKCPTCSVCENHGDLEDEDQTFYVEADDVVGVHGELKKLLQRFKDYHVKLCGEVAEDWADPDQLTEPLAEIIEETESQIDELEALAIT